MKFNNVKDNRDKVIESHLKVYFAHEVLTECGEVIGVQADGVVEFGVDFSNLI